jgi:hypothetical protein
MLIRKKEKINSKSEARNSKQIRNSNVQNSKQKILNPKDIDLIEELGLNVACIFKVYYE